MKKIIWFVYFMAVAIIGRSQSEKVTNDGVYFNKLRPIDDAILKHDFALYKELFRNEYYMNVPAIDTQTKIGRIQYLNDIYFYAAVLSFEKKIDSSLFFLEKIISNKDFNNYDGILGDIAFLNLRKSKKWDRVSSIAYKALLKEANSYKQPELRVRLLALNMMDQSMMLYKIDSSYRVKIMMALDDSVKQIINNFGYPKPINVGRDAAIVPAQILVHSSLNNQLKYKDLIYKEGIAGNIPAGWAGILLDKIQVKENGTQLYGSQYKIINKDKRDIYFYPIMDSTNLIERRRKIGFTEPYETYKNMVKNQFNRK